MAYKNRYVFIKRTYPNTIVLFEEKGNLKGYKWEKEFLNFLHFKKITNLDKLKINYIIVQNMDIIKYRTFPHNMYNIYYKRFKLVNLIESIKERLN